MQFYQVGLFEPELKEIIDALQGQERLTDAGQVSEGRQQTRDRLAKRLMAELWAPYHQSVASGRNESGRKA